jgi:hypothetical protein
MGAMMRKCLVIAGMLSLAAPLAAETYSWVDESGTFNFTEDYSRVPKKYRDKVDKRGDFGTAPSKRSSVQSSTTPQPSSAKIPKAEISEEAGSRDVKLGGKSSEQWEQEFGERERALLAVRKRIDSIDEMLKKTVLNKEQVHRLLAEREKKVEQFSAMQKEFEQKLEIAKKAGF